MSAPTARPILFSAPMIQALLAGRKTQTRRIVKPQPPDNLAMYRHCDGWRYDGVDYQGDETERCPYGIVGQYLWVRESLYQFGGRIEYAADYGAPSFTRKTTPSIHMPRWASRLTLRITDVRVERLQDISETDSLAEGIQKVGSRWEAQGICATPVSAVDAYRLLWSYINGAGSWATNPWCWCLSFSVEKRNVDDVLRDARTA